MVIKISGKKLKFAIIYLILLLTSTVAVAFNLTADEEHPFGIFYDDETPIEILEGKGRTEILFEIPPKYYIYKDSLRVELDDARVGVELELPPSETKFDPFLEKEVEIYHNQLAVIAKFSLPEGMSLTQVTGLIYYQGCSSSLCYRLMKQEFNIPVKNAVVNIGKANNQTKSEESFFDLLKSNDFAAILRHGIGTAMLVAFFAGLITAFTPCVLPVIPLTLAFMGVSGKQKNADKIFSLLVFTAGMALMYAGLGVGAAWLGKTFGFWFASPVFQFVLILFFVMMALWMWGVLNFSVPAGWQNRIVRYQPQGHWRQMYAGLTVGFLAAPCVGPVAGPLLVYVSASQNLSMGGLLMTSYALGLSVLFFMLGFFSRDWIQRFGSRSDAVKKIVGTLLLATAAFYAFIFVKPFVAEAGSRDKFFLSSLAEAEALAKQQQKGVLVDFFADWCLPCQEWDKGTWSDKKVKKAVLEKFIPVKIDCTRESSECDAAVKRFKVIGWPTIIFLDRNLKELGTKRILGQVLDDQEFIKYLDDVSP